MPGTRSKKILILLNLQQTKASSLVAKSENHLMEMLAKITSSEKQNQDLVARKKIIEGEVKERKLQIGKINQ